MHCIAWHMQAQMSIWLMVPTPPVVNVVVSLVWQGNLSRPRKAAIASLLFVWPTCLCSPRLCGLRWITWYKYSLIMLHFSVPLVPPGASKGLAEILQEWTSFSQYNARDYAKTPIWGKVRQCASCMINNVQEGGGVCLSQNFQLPVEYEDLLSDDLELLAVNINYVLFCITCTCSFFCICLYFSTQVSCGFDKQ